MTNEFDFKKNIPKEEAIEEVLFNAKALCELLAKQGLQHLDIHEYEYTSDEAMEELGIDNELVNHLVEDYVIQILKTKATFLTYLEILNNSKSNNKELDYQPLRDLSHKNLGVARNLRIKDAQEILKELMTKSDLDYLALCLKALEACAIKLNPKCAYDTLKLIDIKNSL